jgi:hypothetical protein
VTIDIGPDKTPFTAHKDLLIACSPYFKAAFEGSFREAKEKSIHISDVHPTAFQHFLDWLYFRRLPEFGSKETESEDDEDDKDDEEDANEANGEDESKGGGCECRGCQRWPKSMNDDSQSHTHYEHPFIVLSEEDDDFLENAIQNDSYEMLHLYVLADRCDVPLLRQSIIDSERRTFQEDKNYWSWLDTTYAFRNLRTSSSLCKLMIDELVESWSGFVDCEMDHRLRQKLPADFLYAVMMRQAKAWGEKDKLPCVGHMCKYHEHA